MTRYFRIKNWDRFQHYKDRNPPWIKLHNHLLDNYEFECLTDATKGHLLCIWMLASRTNNKIVYDSSWVKRKIGASSPVDLDLLLSAGFIEIQGMEQDASKMLDSEEKSRGETETEAENKKKVSPKLDFKSWPEMPSDQVLSDWKKLRSRLKANVTQTVINRMGKELTVAKEFGYTVDECLSECVFKGWRGFEAGWLKAKTNTLNQDGDPF